jgi:FixJ family two-component response regulator
VDTRFYVEAIQTGAFDFLAPPFVATDLAYVVRSALDNVVARRAATPLTTHAAQEGLFAEVHQTGAQATSN